MELSPYDRIKVVLAFAAVYLIWGSTFFGVHLALKSFPPFLLSAFRLIIAGAALAIFCVLKKEQLPSWVDTRKNIICGLIIFIGGIVTVVWAQQYISSSLASVIITTPFWFIVLDKKQWKFYFSSNWIIAGLILGLLGVILLVGLKDGSAGKGSEQMQLLSIFIMIAGSFFWVSGSLYLKYKPSQTSVYVSTAIQLLGAGIFCLLLSCFSAEPERFSFQAVQTDALLSLLYLAIISSLITFLAYIWLIKVQPPAIVSTYSYVNPLVATLLGWLFAGEHISAIQLMALAIILIGVLFVNIPKYKMVK